MSQKKDGNKTHTSQQMLIKITYKAYQIEAKHLKI